MVRFRLVLLQDLKQSCACSVADVRIAGSETSRDLAPLVSTETARRYWPEVRCAKRGVLKTALNWDLGSAKPGLHQIVHIICWLKSALSVSDNHAQALEHTWSELKLPRRPAAHRVLT